MTETRPKPERTLARNRRRNLDRARFWSCGT